MTARRSSCSRQSLIRLGEIEEDRLKEFGGPLGAGIGHHHAWHVRAARCSSHFRATSVLPTPGRTIEQHDRIAAREAIGDRAERGLVRRGREIRIGIDRRAERLAVQTEVRPLHAGLLVREAKPTPNTSGFIGGCGGEHLIGKPCQSRTVSGLRGVCRFF